MKFIKIKRKKLLVFLILLAATVTSVYLAVVFGSSGTVKHRSNPIKTVISNPSVLPDNDLDNEFKEKIPILMYHKIPTKLVPLGVPQKNFEQQMNYLNQNGYHTITLDQLYNYEHKNFTLPNKPVIITFDDGYDDNYFNAYPVLKKFGYKATIFIITGKVGQKGFLTWTMIKEMHDSGFIDIGGHTLTHPMLATLPIKVAEKEVIDSKQILQEETGGAITFFSYPYGSYNDIVVQIVKKAGFRGAVLITVPNTDNRVNGEGDIFHLNRIFIGGFFTVDQFAESLEGKYIKPPEVTPKKPVNKDIKNNPPNTIKKSN